MTPDNTLMATAVFAALVDGLDLDALGLPFSGWSDADFAAIGVDRPLVDAALRGDGSIAQLLSTAAHVLGGRGTPTVSRGLPFDAVQLLHVGQRPPSRNGHNRTQFQIPGRIATLDDASSAVLATLAGGHMGAPHTPDVPNVDYVRARVALVAALAAGSASSLLWATGDLSGIQAFLYGLAPDEGGIARRLRARSLFLQLLAEDAAERLRRECGLPRSSILMRSGGKFHLLLPDTNATRDALAGEQRFLDQWLMEQTFGEVALVLSWRSVRIEALTAGGIGPALRSVEHGLQTAKATRFATVLRPGHDWNEAAFLHPARGNAAHLCQSCRRVPAEADSRCRQCTEQTEVGRALSRAESVALLPPAAAANGPVMSLPGSVAVIGSVADGPALLRIPTRSALVPGEAGGIGAYVPTDGSGVPRTFEELLRLGRGRRLLGYLKMDVDRLGEVFTFGLQRDGDESFDSLPRIAAMSRLLDEFFSLRLTEIIRDAFPHCYQVYAGGDDVLVIGPWWDTLRLALAIQTEFSAWIGHNPEITISAGFELAAVHTPVALAAQAADLTLDEAKHGVVAADSELIEARRRRGVPEQEVERPAPPATCVPIDISGQRGRDCAALFGDVLSWEHLAIAVDEAERLVALRAPTALLYRLLAFATMWQEYRDGDPSGLRMFPYLSYTLRRTIDRRQHPELAAWADRLVGVSYRDDQQPVSLEHLGLVVRLAVLLREEEQR